MEYYSAIKKEILIFATTWIDLEGIVLSETSQRKTNTIWFHLYAESKTETKQKPTKLTDTENGLVVARQGVEGGWNG